MALIRRAHEWAADHFRFVQYPRQRARGRLVSESSWLDDAIRWGLFGWAMSAIWGAPALITLCVIVTLIA